MKKTLLTLMALASLTIASLAYTPYPGSGARVAICNAVRIAIADNYGDGLRRDALNGRQFIISIIDIEDNTAFFEARGENGAYFGNRIAAKLMYDGNGWSVYKLQVGDPH